MELYLYISLGISVFLVLFCVLFFPLRKRAVEKKVIEHSSVIRKIMELNEKTKPIDINYPHHIDDEVVCKTQQQLSEYNPKNEFKKHIDEFEKIYVRQQKNQQVYHRYKKAYEDIRTKKATSDKQIAASKIKKEKFLRIENRILDRLFLLCYDKEEIFYRVCSKFVYTDDNSVKKSEPQYVFAKDFFIEDEADRKVEEPQMDIPEEKAPVIVAESKEETVKEVPIVEEPVIETEFECDGITYHIDDEENVSISKADSENISSLELGNVSHNGKTYLLKKIPANVFTNNKNITSLYLSDDIEEIEEDAFRNCFRLEKVEFPPKLKKVGKKAFNGDTALEYVTLPSSLEELDDEAFALCTNIVMFSLSGRTKHVGRSILWLDESVEIHIRDQYPSLWNEHFNVENSKIVYDFEE